MSLKIFLFIIILRTTQAFSMQPWTFHSIIYRIHFIRLQVSVLSLHKRRFPQEPLPRLQLHSNGLWRRCEYPGGLLRIHACAISVLYCRYTNNIAYNRTGCLQCDESDVWRRGIPGSTVQYNCRDFYWTEQHSGAP